MGAQVTACIECFKLCCVSLIERHYYLVLGLFLHAYLTDDQEEGVFLKMENCRTNC